MSDSAYSWLAYSLSELEHGYGKNVHILSNPFLLSHLAQLCSATTYQPTINQLVDALYTNLVNIIVNNEFPRKHVRVPTRMAAVHGDDGVFEGELVDREQAAVCVNLARAGTFPSHICYNSLNYVLNPAVVRQDHISINRATDKSEQVIGANVSGHKIGGDVKGAIVLFPDPMGATGGTLVRALDIYKREIVGPAKKYIAVHLIVTPEYLRAVRTAHPDLVVYAVRVDRGLSSADVLKSALGAQWDRERGLNDKQYIVPGGGGFGEILNNSFV